jgi:hypothetical protein
MIVFGGTLFFIILLVFIILQFILLYNDSHVLSVGFLLVFFTLLYFTVPDWPEFNYKYLIIYPVLAILWLPVYWYMSLLRRSGEIKAGIIRYGNIERFASNNNLSRDIEYENGKYVVNIKHPAKVDLFTNTLFFPISIPLLFGESAINMTIDYITEWMEEIRKNINIAINNSIKNE